MQGELTYTKDQGLSPEYQVHRMLSRMRGTIDRIHGTGLRVAKRFDAVDAAVRSASSRRLCSSPLMPGLWVIRQVNMVKRM
jgi:hypothetical protein